MSLTKADALQAYCKTVREIPELAPEDTWSLAWLSWSGDRAARQELIERHLWLVVELAERLRPGDLLRMPRLVVDGNRALIEAAERYRPWQDGDFSEYAREALLMHVGKEVLPAA